MQQQVFHFTLYGTADCHLCEAAELKVTAVLGALDAGGWRCADIADAPDLLERYATRIPVLREEASGQELDWPFDVSEVVRFAEQAIRSDTVLTRLHTNQDLDSPHA